MSQKPVPIVTPYSSVKHPRRRRFWRILIWLLIQQKTHCSFNDFAQQTLARMPVPRSSRVVKTAII